MKMECNTIKMTQVVIKLISDPQMYIFCEKVTSGRVSYIFKRYSKTKNEYLISYDLKQRSNHTIYLDEHNLYGYAMYKSLPTSRLKWINPKEIDLNKYTGNSSKGYTLEYDLEYLNELRKLQNYYPLARDKIEIKREMISGY